MMAIMQAFGILGCGPVCLLACLFWVSQLLRRYPPLPVPCFKCICTVLCRPAAYIYIEFCLLLILGKGSVWNRSHLMSWVWDPLALCSSPKWAETLVIIFESFADHGIRECSGNLWNKCTLKSSILDNSSLGILSVWRWFQVPKVAEKSGLWRLWKIPHDILLILRACRPTICPFRPPHHSSSHALENLDFEWDVSQLTQDTKNRWLHFQACTGGVGTGERGGLWSSSSLGRGRLRQGGGGGLGHRLPPASPKPSRHQRWVQSYHTGLFSSPKPPVTL